MSKTKRFILTLLLTLPLLLSAQQTVFIGDILCTDGSTLKPNEFAQSGKTAKGIVTFVDESGEHGWAISLDIEARDIHWVDPMYYYEDYDIPLLNNCEFSGDAMQDSDGYRNTMIIRSAHGADWYPAAWCVDFDNGWYLPAASQVRWMVAYITELNQSLAIVGGTLFQHDNPRWWWTSTERTGMHAIVVSETGSVGNYMKYNYYYTYRIGVRAAIDF